MGSFLARRLATIIPTLLFVTMLIFGLQQLLPGDPAVVLAGEDRDPNVVAYLRAKLHLDEPLPIRYAYWLAGVLQGDLGESMRMQKPVTALIAEKLPVTLELAGIAIAIALVIGIPAGIVVVLIRTFGTPHIRVALLREREPHRFERLGIGGHPIGVDLAERAASEAALVDLFRGLRFGDFGCVAGPERAERCGTLVIRGFEGVPPTGRRAGRRLGRLVCRAGRRRLCLRAQQLPGESVTTRLVLQGGDDDRQIPQLRGEPVERSECGGLLERLRSL